jgi:hypothetical protein
MAGSETKTQAVHANKSPSFLLALLVILEIDWFILWVILFCCFRAEESLDLLLMFPCFL